MGVASQDNEIDEVQEGTHDLQPVSAVLEEVNVTAPLSSGVIFEVVNLSPRSSPQLNPSENASLRAPAGVTSASSPLDVTYTDHIPTFASTSQILIAANTTSDLGERAVSFLDLYESYTRTRASIARSRPSIEDGYTFRADHTRTSSVATTLMGTSLRDVLSLQSSTGFQSRINDAHQLISQAQGLQDRRAIERDQVEAEDRVLGLNNEDESLSNGKPTSLSHQSEDFKALFLKAKKDSEEQVKTYEFLLAKAEQDGKNALEEREDEYDDEVKDLKKDLENATKELKDATKELEGAAHKNIVVERRLKKALKERETFEETTKALTEKCKAQGEDVAHKNEQLILISSTLQTRQQDLEAVTQQYRITSAGAREQGRLLEENAVMITDLRQAVQVLAGQLNQYQQAPQAAVIGSLRNENGRLLGVVAESQRLMDTATARLNCLTQALTRAKRDQDCWIQDQLSPAAEDSLSNSTKTANHLAYKDKMYEDLEKRFQDYTTANEKQQKVLSDEKVESENYIDALKKALEIQTAAVVKAAEDKKVYREGMSKSLTTTLAAVPQDDFIEALSFHFDVVQKDNQVLAGKVVELEEEVLNFKEEATRHEWEQIGLLKELGAQKESIDQLKQAKEVVVGELDAVRYTSEVAEECHKKEKKDYQAHLGNLQNELQAQGERYAALNRGSVDERIQYELNSKDNFIQALRDRLNEGQQAYAQACFDRDRYMEISKLDACLEYSENCNVSFFQRQLCISAENYAKLQADLDDVHLRNARDRRLSKEALDEEKARVRDLEKELHGLYQNLQARASQAEAITPADTPPRATSSKPAEDKSAAIEDLAGRLWSCLRGLEMAVGEHGIRVLDHDNEREAIRLACEQLLGLRDVEEDGSPRSTATIEDAGEGNVGNDEPNGETNDSDDNLGEEDATEDDAEAQLQGDYALAEALINDACDALGYAPDDPFRAEEIQRSVYARLEAVEAGEGVEVAPGLGSSTEAVLGDEENPDDREDREGLEGGDGLPNAGPEVAEDESSTTTTTADSEASGGADDDRTVTQQQYDAAAVMSPEHAPALAEPVEETTGTSPPNEGDPDDSMEMTPGTWARRYAPPFMYGEPVEDDVF